MRHAGSPRLVGLAPVVVLTFLLLAGLFSSPAFATESRISSPTLHAGPPREVARPATAGGMALAAAPDAPVAPFARPALVSSSERLLTTPLPAASCSPNYGRAWLAYNPNDQAFWVAAPSACVAVVQVSSNFSTGTVIASYPVGTDPFGVAVDNATNDVFVSNTGSNNVTVISAASGLSVANISVGLSPLGIAYDPHTASVYVANSGSNNVTVISATTLQATAWVPVGSAPVGIAIDPQLGRAFVADSGSDAVSVINTTNHAVVASISVGTTPYGVAFDNTTDRIYVTNEGSNNVSVIDSPTEAIVATVPVAYPGIDLQGIAYASRTGELWVGAGYSYVVRINSTTESVDGYFSTDPSGVAYAPDTGHICFTNTGNFTFACLADGPGYVWPPVSLNFSETGLPSGTRWAVNLSSNAVGTLQYSTTAQISFSVLQMRAWWTYGYSIPLANGYEATPSSGTVPPLNGSTVIPISFSTAPLYPVNFTESGLPPGTVWGITLGATDQYSNRTTIAFLEPNGTYGVSVDPVAGYRPSGYLGNVTVAGASVVVAITFTPSVPPPVNYTVRFVESGLALGTAWSVEVNLTSYASNTTVVSLALPPGTYYYLVRVPSGYVTATPFSYFAVVNGSVTISVTFTSLFVVTFTETGLPSGASWGVAIAAYRATTNVTSIAFNVVSGVQNFSISPPTGWTSAPSSGTLTVSSNLSVPVVFSLSGGGSNATYPVTVQETGLPFYASWTFILDGSFYSTATSSVVVYLPNGTFNFSVGTVPGYAVAPAFGTFQVAGGSVTITLTFAPTSGGTTSSAGNLTASQTLLLAAGVGAVVGALAGVLTGFLFSRRRDPPPQR